MVRLDNENNWFIYHIYFKIKFSESGLAIYIFFSPNFSSQPRLVWLKVTFTSFCL